MDSWPHDVSSVDWRETKYLNSPFLARDPIAILKGDFALFLNAVLIWLWYQEKMLSLEVFVPWSIDQLSFLSVKVPLRIITKHNMLISLQVYILYVSSNAGTHQSKLRGLMLLKVPIKHYFHIFMIKSIKQFCNKIFLQTGLMRKVLLFLAGVQTFQNGSPFITKVKLIKFFLWKVSF